MCHVTLRPARQLVSRYPMPPEALTTWNEAMLTGEPPRAKSLIVTVWGDSIAPLRTGIWLGQLIALMAPFGVNDRLVRTSVFRLGQERWLRARRVGRRSSYALTAQGKRRVEQAERRIYGAPQDLWRGTWTLVLAGSPGLTTAQRSELRRELLWQGYGTIAPGVLAHPEENLDSLREILDGLKLRSLVPVCQAKPPAVAIGASPTQWVRRGWALDELAARYRTLIKAVEPLSQAVADPVGQRASLSAFVARTLLIHAYRRVLLHDPLLPDELLPPDW